MLRIAAFMCIKNDAYYVQMALQSIIPYVDGVYIQDQMSDDGTYEAIMDMKSDRIRVDRVDTGIAERFADHYDEPYYRSMAVNQCEEIFNPDFILKIDGDEIFTPYFFEMLGLINMGGINGVKVSGDRFISPTHRSVHPTAIEMSPGGIPFVDPHIQLWRAKRGYNYIANPSFTRFHPILMPVPAPLIWLDGICNVHLHRLFGPKALAFWSEGTDVIDRTKPLYPPTSCPNFYNSGINMGNAERVDFVWPQYILDRWATWEGGIWE